MQNLRKLFTRLLLILSLTTVFTPVATPLMNTTIVSYAKTYNKATIKNVQKKLNKLDYECGTADGVIGKKTKTAIKEFQKDNDLKVTGTINKTLLKLLGVEETTSTASSSKTSTTSSKSTSTTDSSNKSERTVYITRTGSKYHASGCRYLRQSKISISLSEAQYNYDACSVCNP